MIGLIVVEGLEWMEVFRDKKRDAFHVKVMESEPLGTSSRSFLLRFFFCKHLNEHEERNEVLTQLIFTW